MVFPGAGGYRIEWSPGTRMLPMRTLPTGHSVIECDHFGTANDDNLAQRDIQWTNHLTDFEAVPRSSSSKDTSEKLLGRVILTHGLPTVEQIDEDRAEFAQWQAHIQTHGLPVVNETDEERAEFAQWKAQYGAERLTKNKLPSTHQWNRGTPEQIKRINAINLEPRRPEHHEDE